MNSILDQSFTDYEVILVDDGSTDGSGMICEHFKEKDKRIKVLRKENGGVGSARNLGLDYAKGEKIAFVDSDDYCHKDMLKVLYGLLNYNDACDIAIAGYTRTDSFKDSYTNICHTDYELIDKDRLIKGMFKNDRTELISVWGKLYRHELIKDLRFNNLPMSEDFDFNFRAYLNLHQAVQTESPLYCWAINKDSATHRPTAGELHHECMAKLLFNNFMNLSSDDRILRPIILKQLYSSMLAWIYSSKSDLSINGRMSAIKECRYYMNKTRFDFLICKGIPLKTKFSKLVGIYSLMLKKGRGQNSVPKAE